MFHKNLKQLSPKKISVSLIFHHFQLFNCCLSVILWLDKGDFQKNIHIVCPCH